VVKKPLRHRRLLADAIRRCRKAADLTQEALAELADLNPKYIGEVERGMKNISVDALVRIATATKVPIREFFEEI
jgi:XRE family transcriptional regulator, regulator of sulfur utilization